MCTKVANRKYRLNRKLKLLKIKVLSYKRIIFLNQSQDFNDPKINNITTELLKDYNYQIQFTIE